jgi:hypothetical protein
MPSSYKSDQILWFLGLHLAENLLLTPSLWFCSSHLRKWDLARAKVDATPKTTTTKSTTPRTTVRKPLHHQRKTLSVKLRRLLHSNDNGVPLLRKVLKTFATFPLVLSSPLTAVHLKAPALSVFLSSKTQPRSGFCHRWIVVPLAPCHRTQALALCPLWRSPALHRVATASLIQLNAVASSARRTCALMSES